MSPQAVATPQEATHAQIVILAGAFAASASRRRARRRPGQRVSGVPLRARLERRDAGGFRGQYRNFGACVSAKARDEAREHEDAGTAPPTAARSAAPTGGVRGERHEREQAQRVRQVRLAGRQGGRGERRRRRPRRGRRAQSAARRCARERSADAEAFAGSTARTRTSATRSASASRRADVGGLRALRQEGRPRPPSCSLQGSASRNDGAGVAPAAAAAVTGRCRVRLVGVLGLPKGACPPPSPGCGNRNLEWSRVVAD